MRFRQLIACALAMLAALTILSGCGGSGSSSPAPEAQTEPSEASETAETEELAETPERVSAPPREYSFPEAVFHEEETEGTDRIRLDLSDVSEGWFGISGVSDTRLKVQVIKDENTYTYDISADGTPSIFPLQCGSGTYTVRVMENVEDSKYAELHTAVFDAELSDEFQPFLRSNAYVDFNRASECVKKAAELAGGAETAPEIVAAIYDYICENITYDTEKVTTVSSGYIAAPDKTLAEGSGICFDYASLAAAMLRSQGVPTKLVFGYVSPDGVYHAWNMFYTEETGWVTADFEVSANDWNRLDLTFAASGADNGFIGDGNNYSDVYYY